MTKVHQLKGKLKKGIQSLAFSPSGKVLAGTAIDDNHYVAAYNVETGACLGCEKGDTANILDVAFTTDKEFATAGPKHFKSWTIDSTLRGKKGGFGKRDQRIGSLTAHNGNYLSGAITGELYIWSGGGIKNAIKLHERPLDAVHVNGANVFTGGRDGFVNVLNSSNYSVLFKFEISAAYNSICNTVRSICLHQNRSHILIGTQGSEIYEVPIDLN